MGPFEITNSRLELIRIVVGQVLPVHSKGKNAYLDHRRSQKAATIDVSLRKVAMWATVAGPKDEENPEFGLERLCFWRGWKKSNCRIPYCCWLNSIWKGWIWFMSLEPCSGKSHEEGILPNWPCPTHNANNHSVYELKTSSFKRIVIAHHLDFI